MRLSTVALAALLLLAACQKAEDRTKIAGSGGDPTAAPPAAEMAGAASGMPAFAPPYPGSTIDVNVQGGAGQDSVVSFSTADAPAKVVGFYKEKAVAAGLGALSEASTSGAAAFSAKSADGRSIQVTASPDEDGSTRVDLTWRG